MKFKPGDRIIDTDTFFGEGTVRRYQLTDNNIEFYTVKYDDFDHETMNCPDTEMRLVSKLDKVLE